MKLTNVSVRNFRSFVVSQGQSTPNLPVGDGLNLLVGPNNCGKSNLLRAVSLALEDVGGERFEPSTDVPSQLKFAYPVVTLTFKCNRKIQVEKTLLREVAAYERSAGGTKTHADSDEVVLRVVYRPSGRDEAFAIKGAPNKKGDEARLDKDLRQFRKCIRFIYLRSGESLSHFLSGAFKELLHTVLREHLSGHVAEANRRREQYIRELMGELLTPLGQHTLGQLAEVMEEIHDVKVKPFVPDLEETLSKASIFVADSAETPLGNKGTGVRGTFLVALMGYLARHSKRSLILAVEEPESFLHPHAQEELRDDLVRLAKRKDVTLLVTTHSPFVLPHSEHAIITPLRKQPDGRTDFDKQISGDSPHAPAVSCLFGETITPWVLDAVEKLKGNARAVLMVEGETDKFYLEHAAEVAGRSDLLKGLDIRYGEGACKAAVGAILLRQMMGQDGPIIVLLDSDEHGKSAASLLKKKFHWHGGDVLTYRKWRTLEPATVPVEAEDMLPEDLLEGFAKKHPAYLAEKMQFKDGTFHYGFTQDGKGHFVSYVEKKMQAAHAATLIDILEHVQNRVERLALAGEKHKAYVG